MGNDMRTRIIVLTAFASLIAAGGAVVGGLLHRCAVRDRPAGGVRYGRGDIAVIDR